MTSLDLPIRAATETALAHGIEPDRCDILQNSSTLVLRLTETLVARVVQDVDGPRQGTEWFARENAIAQHLTQHAAPVIPLHPGLPPGPHEHLGYPMNFWEFVTRVDLDPSPQDIGRTLRQCHEIMRRFTEPLPKLAILTESLAMTPAASVSGFYLAHPDSTYFNVGKIGEDQLQDQAARRGADVAQLQRLLAPNL